MTRSPEHYFDQIPWVKEAFLPGFPKDQDSMLADADFEGRERVEIDVDTKPGLKIGGFRTFEYFKDGSMHLVMPSAISAASPE